MIPRKASTKEMLNAKWKQTGKTIAGGTDLGRKLDQLSFPQGMFMDDEGIIYIADWWNNRIVKWKHQADAGEIIAGREEDEDQLNHPTDIIMDKATNSLIIADCENERVLRLFGNEFEVLISDIDCINLAMDKDGCLYVSDCVNHEVRRWRKDDPNGTIVAGGNGKGDQLHQLHYPTFIFIDDDYSLYVSDMNNHRVMKWIKGASEGILVAGGNGNGSRLGQLSYPEGLIVNELGQIYIADSLNHRVMRWNKGAIEGTIVLGGSGAGKQANQLNGPIDLSIDREGNLYVVDCWNHRIQKFEIDLDDKHLLK